MNEISLNNLPKSSVSENKIGGLNLANILTSKIDSSKLDDFTDSKLSQSKLSASYTNLLDTNLLAQYPNLKDLTITSLPAGVNLRFWADSKGYFFWFQNSNNSQAKFYFPDSLKTIEINGQILNVEAQKVNVNQGIMQPGGGFGNFSKTTSAIDYFANMSKLSYKALEIEEKTLASSAQTSNNPYFKIYLADTDVALALKPIIDQVLTTGQANLNNAKTIDDLNKAINLLKQAQSDSIAALRPYNQVPPQNINLPLDPYGIYGGVAPGSPYYYGYWGGSLDQARCREVALTLLRNLIQINALPPIELPPALPPN